MLATQSEGSQVSRSFSATCDCYSAALDHSYSAGLGDYSAASGDCYGAALDWCGAVFDSCRLVPGTHARTHTHTHTHCPLFYGGCRHKKALVASGAVAAGAEVLQV